MNNETKAKVHAFADKYLATRAKCRARVDFYLVVDDIVAENTNLRAELIMAKLGFRECINSAKRSIIDIEKHLQNNK